MRRPVDPLEVVLDRDLPHRAAVTGAAATAVYAMVVAMRSTDERRRGRYAALAAIAGVEAVGMLLARRRRQGGTRGSAARNPDEFAALRPRPAPSA